eukprot:SAG31_NODE_4129_length_3555_cov_25.339988_1_plen_51_part_10
MVDEQTDEVTNPASTSSFDAEPAKTDEPFEKEPFEDATTEPSDDLKPRKGL